MGDYVPIKIIIVALKNCSRHYSPYFAHSLLLYLVYPKNFSVKQFKMMVQIIPIIATYK